jgi:hypothetical protein
LTKKEATANAAILIRDKLTDPKAFERLHDLLCVGAETQGIADALAPERERPGAVRTFDAYSNAADILRPADPQLIDLLARAGCKRLADRLRGPGYVKSGISAGRDFRKC